MLTKNFLVSVAVLALFLNLLLPLAVAQAGSATWQKGVSIQPSSPTDFASEPFRQSLLALAATGSNYVALVIPYYQPSLNSSEMRPGWNTPTDQSVLDAINYAHSIGLMVALKPHIETDRGEWRALIDPADREQWFKSYGDLVLKYAQIGRQLGVEQVIIGTELYHMASDVVDAENGNRWAGLISQLRGAYTGSLTYSSHHSGQYSEKNELSFWPLLDYIGISAYFPLSEQNYTSVEELKQSWSRWRQTEIEPLQRRFNKPILFVEVGYKSIVGAQIEPGDYRRQGNIDLEQQARNYEALFSYWNDQPDLAGMMLWDWQSSPSAGGNSDPNYTPQNKPAQAVMEEWFKNENLESAQPNYSTAAASQPAFANRPLSINVQVSARKGLADALVDVEIYDDGGQKIYQAFYANQTLPAGMPVSYNAEWTPSTSGNYRVKIGLFSSNWQTMHYWQNNALDINVTNESIAPPPPSAQSQLDIWWPANMAVLSGSQPFKGLVGGKELADYQLYWQVDGDRLNPLGDNFEGYPHKETLVDVRGWRWRGNGPYTIRFVALDKTGAVFAEKSLLVATSY